MTVLENRYRVLMASFGDSPSGKAWRRRLGKSHEAIVNALVLNFSADLALTPKDLDQEHVGMLLRELWPGRLGDRSPCIGELPDLVLEFLLHVGVEEGVALEWEWRTAVDKCRDEFAAAMRNGDRPRFAGPKLLPHRRPAEKIGRNDPCPCGSGKKYKRCCAKN